MESLKIKGISVHERVPLAIQNSVKYPDKMYCYMEGKYGYIKKTIYYEDKKKVKFSGAYVFLKREYDPETKKLLTLKETYDNFVRIADNLKELTEGKINLYKTGEKWVKAALKLFKDLEPDIKAEKIEKDEQEWIVNTMKGPLVWGEKYKGRAYKYDIVSRYPSIMISNHFAVPIKRGEFKTIPKNEFSELKFFSFGIWRAKINGANRKLFKINNLNYYTHYDLTRAKELGYEMELIEDEKPNFLFYDKYSRIQGNKIFKGFVDFLFDLKSKNVEGAKEILNNLWGTLCEKNIIKKTFSESEGFDIDKYGGSVIGIIPDGEGHQVSYYEKDSYHSHNWARLGLSLTSLGRKAISTMIEPHLKYIKRVHTDGFYCSKKIEWEKAKYRSVCKVKMGDYLGNMKYEGYCDYVKIINSNNIIGKDNKRPKFEI